ncbi:EI24 domain-containing protein [Undibacterium sp. Rencai35W]|uniref:EI24 domain-containing protein n=1 Tax=Undibacterium sp. Rencai35W TaxID=3413046 RepID=UPI003BF394C5
MRRLLSVGSALGRAFVGQFHPRMLMLTILPLIISILLWGGLMWWGLQSMIDYIQAALMEHDGFRIAGDFLALLGALALKAVLAPLLAMWLLLPLMIVTTLMCIGVFAMPMISRHVQRRQYPAMEARHGGSLLGSLWHAVSSFLIFIVLWVLALPLLFVPVVNVAVHAVLWGWLTYRVMAYDALAEHADADERIALLRTHRWSLLLIGTITGALGAAPSMMWLGGVLAVVFLPVMAAVAVCLYILIFVFSGLWFQYYCLDALTQLRAKPL